MSKSEDRKPCPKCGSTAREFEVEITATVSLKSKLGYTAKHPGGKSRRRKH